MLEAPCTVVAGVKEAGAAAFLAGLLEDAHPETVVHVLAHQSAARILNNIPMEINVIDDQDMKGEYWLKRYKPDFVLVGASTGWSIEKSLILAAKSLSVPVYAFIDNYMNIWQRFAHERSAQRWAYLPDRIYAISNEMVDKLLTEGCPPNVIVLTEHPVLSRIGKMFPSCSPFEFKRNLEIDRTQIVLTLAVETGMQKSDLWRWDNVAEEVDSGIEDILKTLLDFVLMSDARSPGCFVVLIKHHPSDKKSLAHILNKYPPHIFRTIFDLDKLALLDASTAVFGIGSMLLFEAAARNRSAYSVCLSGNGRYPCVTSSRNLEFIRSPKVLREVLNDLGASVTSETPVR